MANAVRVRVELRNKYNDPYKNFKEMHVEFKHRVIDAGVLHDFKNHEYFETKSQKDRQKRRKSMKRRQMDSLAQKIIKGERVKAPSGLIKKVLATHRKNKKRQHESEDNEQ
jgi:ribosomal protein S21